MSDPLRTDPLAYLIAVTLDQSLERHYGHPVADRQWLARTCLEIANKVHDAIAQHPAELVEVPGVSPEEFEEFKTRWREQHGPDWGDGRGTYLAGKLDAKLREDAQDLITDIAVLKYAGVTVEEATAALGFPAADFKAAIAYFDELKFGYAPGVEQRIAELPDATGTFTDDVDGRSP